MSEADEQKVTDIIDRTGLSEAEAREIEAIESGRSQGDVKMIDAEGNVVDTSAQRRFLGEPPPGH